MEYASLLNFIFSMIPRSGIALFFCLSLLNTTVKVKCFVISAFLFSCMTWLTRAILPLGFHSFVAMVFLAFLLYYITYESLNASISTALIYFILLYIIDFFVLYIYNSFTNLSIYEVWGKEIIRILLTMPASLTFVTLSYMVKKYYYKQRHLGDTYQI